MDSIMTELLLEILQYIAYERVPDEQGVVFRTPTKDLISCSLVSRRIRNAALPSLFKNVQINRIFKARRLLEWCQSFPELATLVRYATNGLCS